jgi:hypothetical protein
MQNLLKPLTKNIIKIKTNTGSFQQTLRSMSSSHQFVMDAFAMRQFNNPSYTGTQISYDPVEFEKKINDTYELGNTQLKDGYAPFCKHLFVENFASVTCGCK